MASAVCVGTDGCRLDTQMRGCRNDRGLLTLSKSLSPTFLVEPTVKVRMKPGFRRDIQVSEVGILVVASRVTLRLHDTISHLG